MLAYTAVDGLRAISRDFDLPWQPDVHPRPTGSQRERRPGLAATLQLLSAIALLLPLGAAAWLR